MGDFVVRLSSLTLQNIKNVRRFTASAGSPAPGWTSWPSQTDKADPAGRRPAVRDQKG